MVGRILTRIIHEAFSDGGESSSHLWITCAVLLLILGAVAAWTGRGGWSRVLVADAVTACGIGPLLA